MQFAQLKWLLALVSFANADYHIGFRLAPITMLDSSNTLFDDSCCDSSCGNSTTCCAGITCDPTLRICFRQSQHPMEDTDSPCLRVVSRDDATQAVNSFGTEFSQIMDYYTGTLQAYIRISHFDGVTTRDFTPPFTDPLIDEVFMEFALPAVPFEDRIFGVQPQELIMSGVFNKVAVTLQVRVHCAQLWNGTACEQLCEPGNINCVPIYDGPVAQQISTEPVTTESSTESVTTELSTEPVTTESVTTESPVTTEDSGLSRGAIVGIAVGVSLGVVLLICILLCIIILLCIFCCKPRRWNKDWRPQTVSYNVGPRKTAADDAKVAHDLDDDDPSVLYTPVMKKKSYGNIDGSESPPPVPPYDAGDDRGSEIQGITVVFNQEAVSEDESFFDEDYII